MFRGSITALVTPFADGGFDEKAFEKLVEFQLESGSHGLVPCGTTGESPTLHEDEVRSIFDMSVALVKGRIPVIAGTGSNSTQGTIERTSMAKQFGVDAALIVSPYYNKPTQDGLFAHFKAVHDAVDIPIILYNVAGRTGVEIELETVYRLAELPRIVGIKDAVSDMSRTTAIKSRVKDGFAVLSGEDALAGACLAHGGDGCISVTSNVVPHECAMFQNAWAAGHISQFQELQARLMPLHKALFIETSPQPVKYAMSKLGFCSDEMRLPLLPASEKARAAVDAALDYLNSSEELAKLRSHG